MNQFRGLSLAKIQFGMLRMNSRIFWVSLMGMALFISIFYFAPVSLLNTEGFWLSLSGIAEVICSCFLLERFGKRLITRSGYGLIIYQCIFVIQANIYSLSLSLGVRFLLLNSVTGIYGVSASSMLLLGCIVAISVFAFDLLVCFSFICTLLLPVILTASKSENTLGIAATYSCALTFFCYLGYILHKSEVALLQSEEKITEQNHDLLVSNSALSAANGLFKSTLDNIDEIFLLFDLNGICFGNSVARIAGVLGEEPNGKNLVDILQLEGEERTDAAAWLRMVATDLIDFELLVESGPKECRIKQNGKIFRLRFSQRREGDALTSVILTLLDVSEVLKHEKTAKAAEQRASFVLAASQNRAQFQRLLLDLDNLALEMRAGAKADIEDLRFKLHTMKGATASYYMVEVSASINAIELELKRHTQDPTAMRSLVTECSAKLARAVLQWRNSEESTLDKLRLSSDDETLISPARIERALSYLANDARALASFKKSLAYLQGTDLAELLKGYGDTVQRLATRLEKLVKLEMSEGQERFLLLGENSLVIVKNLIHLLNNSVDHGIEAPTARLDSGKAAHGTIAISFKRDQDDLLIFIKDDGKGIDLNAIKRKMTARNLPFDNLNEEQILRAIFLPDFSTAETLTDISGHGIGLSALQNQVDQVDGTISVRTVIGEGTTFELRLPLEKAGIAYALKTDLVTARDVA